MSDPGRIYMIVSDGWRRAHPIWEIMDNTKLRTPSQVMDIVRYLQLPERHLTTREIIEPHQPVDAP
jgi:hypothetical protein